MTRSSTASPLLSIFHWYSTLGSKKVVLASDGGMKPDTVIARTTLSGLAGLRKVYRSAMSAAWSAASSALSLWSDALIQRVRPMAAAVASSRLHAITRPRDRDAAKRSMVHSSWKKRTGVERHRLYARRRCADCRGLAALQAPTRNGCWVGCAEPPAGSSVTALRSGLKPAGICRVITARPPGSVLNVPTLTGAWPFLMAHSW